MSVNNLPGNCILNHTPYGFIVLAFLIAGSVSCEKGSTSAVLNFKAMKSDINQSKSHLVSEYEIDSMSMIVEAISIEKTIPEEAYNFENTDDSAFYWENMEVYSTSIYGPYIINLIQGTSEPAMDIVDVEPGLYNFIDARILNGTGDSVCFYLWGKTIIDDQEINFELKSHQSFYLELINPDGFEIAQNEQNQIWILTDIDLLFSSLDLGTATMDQDNVIRMNRDSNQELVGIMIENLESASRIELNYDPD